MKGGETQFKKCMKVGLKIRLVLATLTFWETIAVQPTGVGGRGNKQTADICVQTLFSSSSFKPRTDGL